MTSRFGRLKKNTTLRKVQDLNLKLMLSINLTDIYLF